MARPRQEDRVKRWQQRITTANKVYDRWAKKYRCDVLEEYYCGQQWAGQPQQDNSDRQAYVINYVFSTVETQQPSLYFYRPTVKVEPRPPFSDDPLSVVAERAKLCEDTIQTFIDKPSVNFKLQTLLGLRDTQYRFGIVEVGYSADWIDNPHAGKPVLKEGSKDDTIKDDNGDDMIQPERIPKTEDLFVVRRDPRSFRVSGSSDKHALGDNDWCGYFEWHYVEDVKRNKKYRNTAELKASGEMKDDPLPTSDEEREQRVGMVRLWKIWDIRSQKKYVLADGHDKFLLDGEPYAYLPFAVLKFYETNGFYPLPPVFNWLSPQDCINEGREARRTHRRRYNRRYTVYKGGIDDEELGKLEAGEDGTYAKRNTPDDPILPVQDAPLGPDNDKDAIEAKDDFRQISGIGGEQRGDAEAETATQANIIDQRSRIRETAGRAVVAEWLGQISRLMLLTVREKMQLPMWIQQHMDPASPDPNEMLRIAMLWQQITASQLGNDELDVKIDVASLSPVTEDAQRVAWNEVLALITNPALAMILAQSEVLLRKTLKLYGITSERDIQEIQLVLRNTLMMQMAAQATAAEAAGTPSGKPAGQPAGVPANGPTVQ